MGDDEILSGFSGSILGQDNASQAATKEELARKMQDRIRVCNITDSDFTVMWDGLGFVIPSKNKDLGYGPGQQILPRYLAINYIKKMQDEILGKRLVAAVKKAIEERISRGQPNPNHYEERIQIETPFRTDNKTQRDMLIPYLWLGVEEEYGTQLEAVKTDDELARQKQLLAQIERPAQRVDSVGITPDAILGTPPAPELPNNAPLPQIIPTTPPEVLNNPLPVQSSAVDALLSTIETK